MFIRVVLFPMLAVLIFFYESTFSAMVEQYRALGSRCQRTLEIPGIEFDCEDNSCFINEDLHESLR